jgi:hypothetical protein
MTRQRVRVILRVPTERGSVTSEVRVTFANACTHDEVLEALQACVVLARARIVEGAHGDLELDEVDT